MKLDDITGPFFEGRKNKKKPSPKTTSETPIEIGTTTEQSNEYEIHYSKTYNKKKIKYSNKRSNIKLLDSLVEMLRKTGTITGANIHNIKQEIHSEFLGKSVKGWNVAWISRADDLRLAFKKHPNNIIEVKFGTAKDIGYSH